VPATGEQKFHKPASTVRDDGPEMEESKAVSWKKLRLKRLTLTNYDMS